MRRLLDQVRMRLQGDRRGTISIFVAVWLTVVLGIAAVGVDGGYWYLQRIEMQNAADFAVLAGVDSVAAKGGATGIVGAGKLLAQANGSVTNKNGTTVVVRSPPQSGAYAGNPDAVEAIIHRPVSLMLSSFVKAFASFKTPTIGVRAVGLYASTGDNACVLSLLDAVDMSGHSTIDAPNCVIASNDPDPGSISVGGASSVTARTLSPSGGCSGCNNATLTEPYKVNQLPVRDPFAKAQTYTFPTSPSRSFCNTPQPGYYSGIHITNGSSHGNGNGNGNGHGNGHEKDLSLTTGVSLTGSGGLSAQVGINLNGGNSNKGITFAPGLYVIGSGGLKIDGGTVNCAGCTFVFVNGGSLQLNGNATIDFTAMANDPAYPALNGVLFYGDGSGKVKINGGSNTTFTGAVYFPNADVELNGNEGNNSKPLSQCFIAVAKGFTFLGNGSTGFDASGCKNLNMPSLTTRYARLVE